VVSDAEESATANGKRCGAATMNEARLSHLPFWGPSEGCFLINPTAVGLTPMKRSSFGLRVRVNPCVNLGECFIRVTPTDVELRKKTPYWDPKTASGLNALRSLPIKSIRRRIIFERCILKLCIITNDVFSNDALDASDFGDVVSDAEETTTANRNRCS